MSRKFSLELLLVCLVMVLLTVLPSNIPGSNPLAQTPERPQKPAKPAGEDEPVAVTERKEADVFPVEEKLGPNQFGSFYAPQIRNDGAIVFIGRYTNPTATGAGQGVFSLGQDGSWHFVRNTDKVSNLNEKMQNVGPFTISSDGAVIFTASFGRKNPLHPNTPEVGPNDAAALLNSSNSNLGIFVWKDGVVTNLYQLGIEVPNMPSRFSSFSNPSINSKGAVAFVAAYIDPDGRGLFIKEGNNLRVVARSGQRVSAKDTATFSEHFYPSRLNDNNEIAFFIRLGSGSAIMVSRPSGLEVIARDGMLSPVRGAKYIGFGNRAPAINDKGDVVFVGFYSGVNAGRAVFVKGVGPTRIVARTNDKTSKFPFSDFMQPSINNRGDVCFIGRSGGRNQGVYLSTKKGLELIAQSEQVPPGFEKGSEFNNFHMPSLNDNGDVVFYAQLKSSKYAIFKKDATGLKKVIQRGDPIPPQAVVAN